MRENVTLEQCNFSYDAILQDPKVRMREADGEKLRQFVCSKYVVRQPIKAHSVLDHWIWELYSLQSNKWVTNIPRWSMVAGNDYGETM